MTEKKLLTEILMSVERYDNWVAASVIEDICKEHGIENLGAIYWNRLGSIGEEENISDEAYHEIYKKLHEEIVNKLIEELRKKS